MDDSITYNEPSDVTAAKGEVHVEGPDGVDVLLTPAAAIETSDRLLNAGMTAHGQRIIEEQRKRDHPRWK